MPRSPTCLRPRDQRQRAHRRRQRLCRRPRLQRPPPHPRPRSGSSWSRRPNTAGTNRTSPTSRATCALPTIARSTMCACTSPTMARARPSARAATDVKMGVGTSRPLAARHRRTRTMRRTPMNRMRLGAAAASFLALCWAVALGAEESPTARARAILEAAGVQGGLVVHLGCGGGRLTAALRAHAPSQARNAMRVTHIRAMNVALKNPRLTARVSYP